MYISWNDFFAMINTIISIVELFFAVIGSCFTALSIIYLIISLVFLKREIHEARTSTYAGAYKAVVEILQDDNVRKARRYLFENLEKKPFESWSPQDRREAEKVCHTYDTVGQMIRYSFLPKKYIVDSWGASLRRTWKITCPLVYEFRQNNNAAEMWDDYEWLANEAKSFQKPLS